MDRHIPRSKCLLGMIILFVIVGLLAGLLFLMLSASFIYKSYKAAIPHNPGGRRYNLPVISYVGRSSRISIVPLPGHYFRKDTRASLFSNPVARSRLFTDRDTRASLFTDRESFSQSLDQQSVIDHKSMHSVIDLQPPPTIVTQESQIYTIQEAD